MPPSATASRPRRSASRSRSASRRSMGEFTRASGRATSSCRSPTSGTSRSSRCSTTPPATRRPSGRPSGPAPRPAAGWLGWVVQVDDISERRVAPRPRGRRSATGTAPTGSSCAGSRWASRACRPTRSCPTSSSGRTGVPHPSDDAHTEVTIDALQIAGDPDRVRDWLGLPADSTSSVIDFEFVSPHGTPGLMAVTFDTPHGRGHHLTPGPRVRPCGSSCAAAGCSTPRARSTAPSRRRRSSG